MSDGGDGFGEVLRALLSAKARAARTCDAAHRPCTARWWWEPKTKTAILESARVVGLAMLPPGRFHPFDLDTRGLGILLQTVARMGARRCLVGLGGSATNDGGFGLARALGWEFLDREGRLIERWTGLSALARIRAPKQRLQFKQVAVAVDVQNPLLGARGATRVYGPQKGLVGEDFRLAEKCLRRLAQVINKDLGCDLACVPGAGAAGGLGFGFLAFLGARLESGFELFSCYANLERRLKAADVVITGEGSIDHSTLMGKGAGEIARRCQKLGIPCIGLTGVASKTIAGRRAFTQIRASDRTDNIAPGQGETRVLAGTTVTACCGAMVEVRRLRVQITSVVGARTFLSAAGQGGSDAFAVAGAAADKNVRAPTEKPPKA